MVIGMKKKQILKGLVITGICLVGLVTFDQIKMKKVNTPPKLMAVIDGTEADYLVQSYSKNDKTSNSRFNDEDNPVTNVNPRSKVEISFDDAPDLMAVEEIHPGFTLDATFKEVIEETEEDMLWNPYLPPYIIEINNQPFIKTYVVQAKWKDGKKAAYTLQFNVKKETSYQKLLSDSPKTRSLFMVIDSFDNNPFDEVRDGGMFRIDQFRTVDLAEAYSSFPELKIEKTPTYVVFDYTKEVFRSHQMEDLVEFLHQF